MDIQVKQKVKQEVSVKNALTYSILLVASSTIIGSFLGGMIFSVNHLYAPKRIKKRAVRIVKPQPYFYNYPYFYQYKKFWQNPEDGRYKVDLPRRSQVFPKVTR